MVVAVVAVAQPTWYAHDDLALTEMRVRDVTSTHPPLVGLSGRIEHDGAAGSHPGPLSFYLLAPTYRAFGSSAWAMQVGTAALAFAAVGSAVWIGRRRGGTVTALASATGMLALLVAYGADRWAFPWNPHLPLLWWPVVLLAAWSVLCRDWSMIVVFVAAASFCAQTHISYVGLVGGLGLVVAVATARAAWSARGARLAPARGPGRWPLAGAALLLVLWVPPLLEEVRTDPGNLTIIAGQFLDPDEGAAGWGRAADVTLARLDPAAVIAGRDGADGPSPGGVVVLVGWVAAAAVTVRRRTRLPDDLLRLHIVVGAAVVLGAVSLSRVQGLVYPYLTLWSWGTAVVMVAATAWTAGALRSVGRAPARSRRALPVRAATLALLPAGLMLVLATVDAARARTVEVPDRVTMHDTVLPQAIDALAEGRVDGFDLDDRYLARARDGFTGGLSVFTLLNELERRGFEAGLPPSFAVAARHSRVMAPDAPTAIVTYASGPAIEEMRDRRGAIEIAAAELPPAAQAEAERARDDLVETLTDAGRRDLVPLVDANVLGLALTEDPPAEAAPAIARLVEIGGPVAIFVEPARPR